MTFLKINFKKTSFSKNRIRIIKLNQINIFFQIFLFKILVKLKLINWLIKKYVSKTDFIKLTFNFGLCYVERALCLSAMASASI